MTIKVTGLRELDRNLKATQNGLERDLRKISKAGAEIVAADARRRAPVRSGRLQATIAASGTTTGGRVFVGGKLRYAKPIVFGWPRHGIAANKFPYEALDAKRAEVVTMMAAEISQLVERSFQGGSGG